MVHLTKLPIQLSYKLERDDHYQKHVSGEREKHGISFLSRLITRYAIKNFPVSNQYVFLNEKTITK